MPTKIRLARHGRKNYAYYHIVVADSRAPRDGRYTERIGSYNPNNDPATIELDFERALDWVLKGAQPTDTVRSILSKEGVLLKKHLVNGVRKGAFDEAEADKRFEAWMADKQKSNEAYVSSVTEKAEAANKERMEIESKVNEARLAEISARKAALVAEAEAEVEKAKAEAEAKAAAEAETEETAAEETEATDSEETEKGAE